MRRVARLGLLSLVPILLTGCLGCIGGSDGIGSVAVVGERLVVYEVADDFELGYIVPAGFESSDLGATWTAIASDDLPAYNELPGGEGRGVVDRYAPAEWCGASTCYVVDDLSLTIRREGEVIWQPPPGRAEFVDRAVWEPTGGPLACTPDRNMPMRLTGVAGGTIGGNEVGIVGAGPDGVLVVSGQQVSRVGVGRWQPRDWTKPLSGISNLELLPLAIIAILSLLATAAVIRRSPSLEETAPEKNLRKYPLLDAFAFALLGLLGVDCLPAAGIPHLRILVAGHGRGHARGLDGRPPSGDQPGSIAARVDPGCDLDPVPRRMGASGRLDHRHSGHAGRRIPARHRRCDRGRCGAELPGVPQVRAAIRVARTAASDRSCGSWVNFGTGRLRP